MASQLLSKTKMTKTDSKPISYIAEDGRRWYRYRCPGCGRGLASPKSETMGRGLNTGSATCIHCGLHLHVRLVPSEAGTAMEAQEWAETIGMPLGRLKRRKRAAKAG